MRRIIGNIPFQGRKFFFTAHRESVSPLLFAWFFYHSFWAVLPLSPLILFTFKETEKRSFADQRQRLADQFKDTILSCRSRAAGRILH